MAQLCAFVVGLVDVVLISTRRMRKASSSHETYRPLPSHGFHIDSSIIYDKEVEMVDISILPKTRELSILRPTLLYVV